MTGAPAAASAVRSARLRAFAKINLSLRVIDRRPDQYHELRTIFQTISLADRIDVAFTPSRRTSISIRGNIEIPNNLILRAAELCLDAMRATGRVEFQLHKRIPMGAGLGGGSSDAAAVLLALPVLAGTILDLETLIRLATELGSDVPFFLIGGTAVGIGRGAELYPLPDAPARAGVLVTPDLRVSTAAAYRLLSGRLTMESQQNKIVSFQSRAWRAGGGATGNGDPAEGANDFETVVFAQYPRLARLQQRLLRLGARPARMSGSGSALFGLFRNRGQVHRAIKSFGEEHAAPITLVSRARYRSVWWKQLRAHMRGNLWPPQSRYAR